MFASTLFKDTPCPDSACSRGLVCHFSHDAGKNLSSYLQRILGVTSAQGDILVGEQAPREYYERDSKRRKFEVSTNVGSSGDVNFAVDDVDDRSPQELVASLIKSLSTTQNVTASSVNTRHTHTNNSTLGKRDDVPITVVKKKDLKSNKQESKPTSVYGIKPGPPVRASPTPIPHPSPVIPTTYPPTKLSPTTSPPPLEENKSVHKSSVPNPSVTLPATTKSIATPTTGQVPAQNIPTKGAKISTTSKGNGLALLAMGTGVGQAAQNTNVAGAVVGTKTFAGGLTSIEYPTIKIDLRPKVPRTVRQTFLDKVLVLFLERYPNNKKKAVDEAVKLEQDVYNQAATKNIYVNLFAIKMKKSFPTSK
jgi:hypothetical protein